ncbi:MAG: TetR/AcrR family transcriptional regulator [bacterium]
MNNINEDVHLSRKEREKIFRKNEISFAATKLFAEKGYDATTLEEIAEASEFGKGTIYNYFESKEEIFKGIVDEIFLGHLKMLEDVLAKAKDFKDIVTMVTRDIFDFCINNPSKFEFLVHLRTNSLNLGGKKCQSVCCKYDLEIYTLYKEKIKECIQNGELIDIDPEALVLFYPSFVFPYIRALLTYKGAQNINTEKEINFLLKILFNGILKSGDNNQIEAIPI